MDTNTTRRQLLALGTSAAAYAAGAAIVAGGVALANEAKADALDTAGWDKAMSVHDAVKREHDAYEPVHDTAYEAYHAEIEPLEAALPYAAFPFENRGYVANTLDLDEAEQHIRKRAGVINSDAHTAEQLAAIGLIREFRNAKRAAAARLNLDAIGEEMEARTDAYCDSRHALMEMPAPNLAALRWKLDYAFAECREGRSMDCWHADFMAQTIADYQRLLVGKAQA